MSKIYKQAYEHVTFNKVIDQFVKNLLLIYHGKDKEINNVDEQDLKKAGWIATMLADSREENHKQKAQTFAILLYILHPNDINLSQLSYVIFSRVGNLVATKFLENLFSENQKDNNAESKFKYTFNTILDFELGSKRYENTVDLGQSKLLVTDFQKRLWKGLNSHENVSISAPTSSGKSFIIQSYLQKKFNELEEFTVLYIVPSRALLNQVSEEFHYILDSSVDIRTAYIEKVENVKKDKKKRIYILTPERSLKLLEQDNTNFYPDFVFVDEIQNVEDENGRGVLFEYILEQMSLKWEGAQFVSAGPFIVKNKVLFNALFKKESENVETIVFPTLQFKTIVKPDIDKNELLLIPNLNNKNSVIKIPVELNLKSTIRQKMGDFLASILMELNRKEQNIIYAPRTDYAEKWCITLAANLKEEQLPSGVEQLIEFLAEEIHPKYYLIKCLRHRIAFHHSKLPELVRKEIENLFTKGEISYLYCTSTLLQGVNLPAKNLFVISPRKRSEPLTSFEFGNLIGRAGRIRNSLTGMVYYVTRNDEDEALAEKFFQSNYQKEVKPAVDKTLENSQVFLSELKNEDENGNAKSKHTIILLKHKFLSGKQQLVDYLHSKSVSEDVALNIVKELEKQTAEIKLPTDIIRLNPSVDPSLQEKLYKRIRKDGIENWVIHFNENFYKRIRKENLDHYKRTRLSFYWQLALIMEGLNNIFSICDEAFYSHNISLSINSMAYSGFRWLSNRSYNEIIEEDLNFHANVLNKIDINDEEDINTRIKDIMNIQSKIVTFLLVKYFKVLTDILEFCMSEEEKENYKFTLGLPLMLELGTTESKVIELISSGIHRSVALKLFNELKQEKDYETIDIFKWLKLNGNNLGLRPLYLKYLNELGYISVQN